MKGVMGKVLRVDLTGGTMREEPIPEAVYEQLIGGVGLGAYYLYQHIPADADPLGPENILGYHRSPADGGMPTVEVILLRRSNRVDMMQFFSAGYRTSLSILQLTAKDPGWRMQHTSGEWIPLLPNRPSSRNTRVGSGLQLL